MNARPLIFSLEMVRALLDGRKTQTRRILSTDAADAMDFMSGSGKYQPEDEPNDPTPVSIMWGESEDDDGNKEKPQWLAYMDEYPEVGVQQIGTGYGNIGDLLWVKESYVAPWGKDYMIPGGGRGIFYRADHSKTYESDGKWKTGRFMFRWASRFTLKITNIRVERVQDVSEADAKAEGLITAEGDGSKPGPGYKWRGVGYHGGHMSKDGLGPCFHTPNWNGSPGCSCVKKGPTPAQCAFRELWDFINAERGYGWIADPWVWVITFEVIKQNVDNYIFAVGSGSNLGDAA